MIGQLDRHFYRWIIEAEMFLLLRRGINPYEIEESMTMWDFQNFLTTLLKKIEDEENNMKNGKNTLIEQLVNLRDYLNIMKLPDKKNVIN